MNDIGQYVPSQEALEFIAFIRASGIEENANAEIHYRLADKYFSRDKQILIESFRGSAKSTIMEWAVIYTSAKGEIAGIRTCRFYSICRGQCRKWCKKLLP